VRFGTATNSFDRGTPCRDVLRKQYLSFEVGEDLPRTRWISEPQSILTTAWGYQIVMNDDDMKRAAQDYS